MSRPYGERLGLLITESVVSEFRLTLVEDARRYVTEFWQKIGVAIVEYLDDWVGVRSYSVGDILVATSKDTMRPYKDVVIGNVLLSGGVRAAPSWGKVGLTTHVTGILPVGNGGSGTSTAFTAGSIVFAGANGVYTQNNASLFWNNSTTTLSIPVISTPTVSSSTTLSLQAGSATKMTILSSGNVGIGAANPGYALEVVGDAYKSVGGETWATSSDERIKQNIVAADLDRCYNIVKNLPLKHFTWRYPTVNTIDHSITGWVAQDVQQFFPNSVKSHKFIITQEQKDENGVVLQKEEAIDDCLHLTSDQIIHTLYGAVQKLQEMVEVLIKRQ